MMFASQELVGFLQRPSNEEYERNDQAADEERNTPTPVINLRR